MRTALMLVSGAMVLLVAWWCAPDLGEPRYRGRALSHWLDEVADEIDRRSWKPEVIAEAHEAIQAAGTNAIPYIIRRIKATNTWVNFQYRTLYWFVWDHGPVWLWDQLPEPRQNFDFRDGERAFWIVGHAAAPAAVLALKDSNQLLREVAAEFLAEIRYRCETNGTLDELRESIRPYLLKELEDPDAWVRDQAVHLLGRYGIRDAEVVAALTRCLKDAAPLALSDNYEPEYSIQTAAASALAKLGPAAAAAVPALVELERDAEPHTRLAAAIALQAIQPDAATTVPVCVQGLNTTNASDIRHLAAEGLYRMGPPAKETLASFVQRSDTDVEVRAAITKVIESIDLNAAANARMK